MQKSYMNVRWCENVCACFSSPWRQRIDHRQRHGNAIDDIHTWLVRTRIQIDTYVLHYCLPFGCAHHWNVFSLDYHNEFSPTFFFLVQHREVDGFLRTFFFFFWFASLTPHPHTLLLEACVPNVLFRSEGPLAKEPIFTLIQLRIVSHVACCCWCCPNSRWCREQALSFLLCGRI